MDIEAEKLGKQLSQRITDILNDPKAKEQFIKDMAEFGNNSRFIEPKYR